MKPSIAFARSAYRCKNRFRTSLGLDLFLWAVRYLRKHGASHAKA
mgnify:CR=1 FL=1